MDGTASIFLSDLPIVRRLLWTAPKTNFPSGEVSKAKYSNYSQGRNHGENLGSTSVMVGRICPPWLG